MTVVANPTTEARDQLSQFETTLSQRREQLTSSEAELQRLRREATSLDDLALARVRHEEAQTLLSQLEQEVTTARAELARHEAEDIRQATLDVLRGHAQQATVSRQALERVVAEGGAVLQKTLDEMDLHLTSIRDARASFADAATAMEPGFRKHNYDPDSVAKARALLRELNLGADLVDVLDAGTGRYTGLDTMTRPLPSPSQLVGWLLWQGVLASVPEHERSALRDLAIPLKPV